MNAPTSAHPVRAALVALATALLFATGLAYAPPAGAQQGPTTMTFDGRGWGHGRGMSQYGAQGMASRAGATYDAILDHYYGGTTMGTRADQQMRIRLMSQDDRPTTVAIDSGTVRLEGNKGLREDGLRAVRMTRKDDGTLRIESASSCSGPWTVINDGGQSHVEVIRDSGSEPLRLCRADGTSTWYPGTISTLVHNGTQRTINTTSMDSALRSIVPRESPASWHQEALKAQSVAARSYALAGDNRHQPYADTCDTIVCQVYAGSFQGASKTPTTDPRTDQAIQATAGEVRVHANGTIARTEFSSTSGGHTAGGTFPAVPDPHDSISPRHTWTLTVDMTRLENQHGQGSRLTGVEVLRRNGLGADGGRVLTARLHFASGRTVDVTGDQVRSLTGLYSDWFTPSCAIEAGYVTAVYDLFLDRAPSGTEAERGCSLARSGQRFTLTTGLSRSDEWAGRQINELYRTVFGRAADSSGRSYWLSQVERGQRIEDIAANFYGSTEYFNRAGRTPAGFVDRLYRDLMGRGSDPSGRSHWIGQLGDGRLSRPQVAGSFYASLESRRDRVDALYRQVLDRAPDATGRNHWVGELLRVGDVALAAHLAASEEYFRRAVG